MEFYSRYNPPPSPSTVLDGPSLARQDAARECDINYILARVGAGVQPLTAPEPMFADLSEVPDNYQELVSRIGDLNSRFESLPVKVRDRFAEDPSALFSFLSNPANRDEAVKLGLIMPPVVPDAAAAAPAASEEA